jgi:hypothetical protein
LPALRNKTVGSFVLFTLKDGAEQDDDCANIYHKSLLYLVSNAFEEKSGLFFAHGEPLLGMEHFILDDPEFQAPAKKEMEKKNPASLGILGLKNAEWIRSPNGLPEGNISGTHARHHGDFDDDKATVLATLARITGAVAPPGSPIEFRPSMDALHACRRRLER